MARARRARPPASGPPGDERTVELARRLATLLGELGLSEIEIESAEVRVRVQRAAAPVLASPATLPPAAPDERPLVTDLVSPTLVTVEAPMVGTFYRASSPTADPYVQEGDAVKEGQVVCIIEAMKLMNEIQSEVRGKIARVLVENATPVEFGQDLFLVKTE